MLEGIFCTVIASYRYQFLSDSNSTHEVILWYYDGRSKACLGSNMRSSIRQVC